MTGYWDDWSVVFSKIERGEKVDSKKLLDAFHELFWELHEFDHKSKDGHILGTFLRKNKRLNELLKELSYIKQLPKNSINHKSLDEFISEELTKIEES